MYISYKNGSLEKICTTEAAARRKLRNELYMRRLFQRIVELQSFDSLKDVPVTPPLRRHKLQGSRQEEWAVVLKDGWRICFSALSEDGVPSMEYDLGKIHRIRITDIRDYHG